MKDNSRWDLADDDVGRYLARSYDYIIDLLRGWIAPSRSSSTRRATTRCAWRSACADSVLRAGGEERLHEEADALFRNAGDRTRLLRAARASRSTFRAASAPSN